MELSSEDFFQKTLSEISLAEVSLLPESTSVKDCVSLMSEKKWGILLIGEGDNLTGIFSERDVLFRLGKDFDEHSSRPVSEFMTPNPMTLKDESTLYECLVLFRAKSIRHIPIVGDGKIRMMSIKDMLFLIVEQYKEKLKEFPVTITWKPESVRIVSENFHVDMKDLKGSVSDEFLSCTLEQIYSVDYAVVEDRDSLADITEKMKKKNSGIGIVMAYETEIVGVITERDFLTKGFGKVPLSERPKNIMTANPHTLGERHFIGNALSNMEKFKYRNIIVADEEGYPIGVVTLLDILRFVTYLLDIKIS